MALNRYSKKEPLVFLWVILPYIIFLNLLLFGGCIFNSLSIFFRVFLYSAVYILLIYFVFGIAATLIQRRFSAAGDMFKRIAIMLPMFYVMNTLAIPGIYFMYNQWPLVACATKAGMLFPTILYACLMSTIITFINEGVANWDAWKASITETERMKNVYQRSRVLCLKGQINPHFLFNCFNTLSGLIQEDEAKAEKFLDEMTKVHRYLLRSDEELLVSLDLELKFAASYLYLARERFGDSVQATIEVDPAVLGKNLPPHSMQVILENVLFTNALNKNNPLIIHISSKEGKYLSVENSIHEKSGIQSVDTDDGLNNLQSKYEILNADRIIIREDGRIRSLLVPLFEEKSAHI